MALLFLLQLLHVYIYIYSIYSWPYSHTQRTQIEANAAIYAVTGIAGVRRASAQGHRAGELVSSLSEGRLRMRGNVSAAPGPHNNYTHT